MLKLSCLSILCCLFIGCPQSPSESSLAQDQCGARWYDVGDRCNKFRAANPELGRNTTPAGSAFCPAANANGETLGSYACANQVNKDTCARDLESFCKSWNDRENDMCRQFVYFQRV